MEVETGRKGNEDKEGQQLGGRGVGNQKK